jgi:hypothetical protein
MMLARYKKIANFTFLARWANLAKIVSTGVKPILMGGMGGSLFFLASFA